VHAFKCCKHIYPPKNIVMLLSMETDYIVNFL